MRRTDRQVTDTKDILSIIDKCSVLRLALCLNAQPYIVPMNFGYEYASGALTIYLHCAHEGKKLDIISQNSAACFEVDCSHKLITGEDACSYSMEYESVIGTGRIEVVQNPQEKTKGLMLLMQKYAPDKVFNSLGAYINSVTILKLRADGFSGKRHIPRP